jgi:hypothetical protein
LARSGSPVDDGKRDRARRQEQRVAYHNAWRNLEGRNDSREREALYENEEQWEDNLEEQRARIKVGPEVPVDKPNERIQLALSSVNKPMNASSNDGSAT